MAERARHPRAPARPTRRDRAWWLAYRAAYGAMRLWWFLRPRPHRGALVALEVDGTYLVIRNSYRRGWTFPGGGVEPGETALAAAGRELREELGLVATLDDLPTTVSGVWEGRPDTVAIFDLVLPAFPTLRLDYREVVEARFVTQPQLLALTLTGPVAAYVARRWPLSAGDEHPAP